VTRLTLVVLLVPVLVVPAFAQTRGILVKAEPQPIEPAKLQAELAAIQPLWSTGRDWSGLTVSLGVSYSFAQPQSEAGRMLMPDRLVAFVAKDSPAFEGGARLGGTVDWDVIPDRIAVCVGGVAGVGFAIGVKATAVSAEF